MNFSDILSRRQSLKLEVLLFGLIACGVNRNTHEFIQRYEGETIEYFIKAEERISQGFCVDRTITLKEKNGLHIKPNHVDYVRASDYGCDDKIDDFRFRMPILKDNINLARLEEDILNAFYDIKFRSQK